MLEHNKLERLAEISVARGCGFGLLAIFTMMIGFGSDMALAFRAGGILALFACMVLLLKAIQAGRRSYRRTELWIMLDPEERPSEATAQRIIGTLLRGMYLKFARLFALGSACLLAGSLLMATFGPVQSSVGASPEEHRPTLTGPRGLDTSAFRRIP